MRLTKCDICKKKLKGDSVRAGLGLFQEKDFCVKCGKPVLDFLEKHKLLENKNDK